MHLRKGVKLLDEKVGDGPPVERQQNYRMAMRITLSRGDVVRLPEPCLPQTTDETVPTLEDGYLLHHVRVDRECLIAGVFYAVQGMNVGGYRKVEISPHLAYGEKGIPDLIPPHAKLMVEIIVLSNL